MVLDTKGSQGSFIVLEAYLRSVVLPIRLKRTRWQGGGSSPKGGQVTQHLPLLAVWTTSHFRWPMVNFRCNSYSLHRSPVMNMSEGQPDFVFCSVVALEHSIQHVLDRCAVLLSTFLRHLRRDRSKLWMCRGHCCSCEKLKTHSLGVGG